MSLILQAVRQSLASVKNPLRNFDLARFKVSPQAVASHALEEVISAFEPRRETLIGIPSFVQYKDHWKRFEKPELLQLAELHLFHGNSYIPYEGEHYEDEVVKECLQEVLVTLCIALYLMRKSYLDGDTFKPNQPTSSELLKAIRELRGPVENLNSAILDDFLKHLKGDAEENLTPDGIDEHLTREGKAFVERLKRHQEALFIKVETYGDEVLVNPLKNGHLLPTERFYGLSYHDFISFGNIYALISAIHLISLLQPAHYEASTNKQGDIDTANEFSIFTQGSLFQAQLKREDDLKISN